MLITFLVMFLDIWSSVKDTKATHKATASYVARCHAKILPGIENGDIPNLQNRCINFIQEIGDLSEKVKLH